MFLKAVFVTLLLGNLAPAWQFGSPTISGSSGKACGLEVAQACLAVQAKQL